MLTKKEMQEEIDLLKSQIKPSISINNCNIDTEDKSAIAIAEAVKAGMEALQKIADKNSYGIYIAER